MSTTALPADEVLTGLNSRLEAAQKMADAGGDVLRHYFTNQGWSVEDKADGSPVTTADRETEACIRQAIQEAFPGDGLIGEEYGDKDADGTTGFRWVIDPIDGTISFVHGVPMFGILIGIEHDSRPLAGLMDFPILHERAFAVRGTGAWHQTCGQEPVPARVSNTCSLQEAMVCTTSFDYFRDHDYPDAYVALGQACRRTRGWSDCYCELLLCTGRVDAVVEPELKRWDIGAIVPILQEAGGRFTDWAGNHDGDPGVLRGIASNNHVHEALVSIMKQWP
ncbi:MAG: inositol monophosphatase family protein [Planctomycetota bacterium]|nr:inositol monophosphatase family protein [Planctomycetota bacterium]